MIIEMVAFQESLMNYVPKNKTDVLKSIKQMFRNRQIIS